MANSEFATGDIVVVPFPYSDQLAEKRRPALVISNASLAKRHNLLWVAMITSAIHNKRADDIALPLNGTGLTAPSIIRPAKIATIETTRVIRIAGQADAATMMKLRKAVRAYLVS